MASDWELLESWRGGDCAAGDELVSRYFRPVSRFFRAKLGDDVDDPVQQTFLACVEGRDRIEGSFRSYLFGVARRRLLDHLRRTARTPEKIDLSAQSLADLGTSPSQTIARGERQARVIQALATIPVDAQIILELQYWEDLSGAEIAAVLEIEPATVRSRLTRARARLRKALVEMGGDADWLPEIDDEQ